ncbi:MAG TPA: ABC transporter permease subunit [Streptosporangiaceae bacterium]|nr:ABC transporter permease subunit [Streptosporangiaceae bacterium]
MTALDSAPPDTTVPPFPASAPQQPRPVGTIRTPDVLALVGSLAAAAATTGILWTQLSPFSGILGYVVVTWCLFVFYYAMLVRFDDNRPTVRDRVAAVVVHSLAALVLAALVDVIIYTVVKAWPALVHLNLYTQDLATTELMDPLTKGGILHAIIGTLIEVGIAMGIAVPFGMLTAVFMHEVPGAFARLVRTVIDAMTALPDVLAGLFVYATLILFAGRGLLKWFGPGFYGFAAACALAITVIPIVARASYVVLRLVPGGLTEASYALGSGQWRTVWHVTLPTARSGLATAVILGTARAIGETSPVLLTAGVSNVYNYNPLHQPMMSLPLLAFISEQKPPGSPFIQRGFACAAVLLVLVLVLFVTARAIGGRGPGQLSPRQQRRRAAESHRDLARFTRRQGAHIASGIPWEGS